jgi:hypothetical protein
MAIKNFQPGQAGLSGTVPNWVYIATTDPVATVIAAGYLNGIAKEYPGVLQNNVMAEVTIIPSANMPVQVLLFQVSVANGVYSLVQPYVLANPVDGQVVTVSTALAAPGTIRALTGAITETVAMTSGNIVGIRGSATLNNGVSGSSFVYGTQGKVVAHAGTLASSAWIAGVFGQFDFSGATITSGQFAPLWGDMGATMTSGTYSGMYGIAMTNTTAGIANAQVYLYGGATYLMELNDNNGLVGATYYKAAGTSSGSAGYASGCNATKVLEILINGTPYYIPAFVQNS